METDGGCKVLKLHDDGDMTVRCGSTRFVLTTEGEVFRELDGGSSMLIHVMEHEVVGSGRVIDAARARATPCKAFEFEGETYAWSPGVLGLMSSKKNPEQIRQYCALGMESAGAGAAKRFKEIKSAVGEAHKEWEAEGGDLKRWWEKTGEKLTGKGIEL